MIVLLILNRSKLTIVLLTTNQIKKLITPSLNENITLIKKIYLKNSLLANARILHDKLGMGTINQNKDNILLLITNY